MPISKKLLYGVLMFACSQLSSCAYSNNELFEANLSRDASQMEKILLLSPWLAGEEKNVPQEGKVVTPMTDAAGVGWVPAGEILLRHFASLQKGSPSPLIIASERGHLAFVEFLLSKGADPNLAGSNSLTPLHAALWNGHRDVAAVLLKKGARTDLFADAALGKVDAVKAALQRKPSLVNDTCPGGGFLIHWAAAGDSTEVANLLLKEKPDLNAKGEQARTPLDLAVHARSQSMVRWLLDHGADFKIGSYDETPLETAIRDDNREALELLIERGADINRKGVDGANPLYLAAFFNRLDIAKLLLAKGTKVNALADQHSSRINDSPDFMVTYQTPLHAAVMCNSLDMVKLLVENHADVNAKANEIGGTRTPLSIAKSNKYTEIADYLEGHGAKP